jgi:ubiquinone/menaquinone biosynthesis C-methylase UbiE
MLTKSLHSFNFIAPVYDQLAAWVFGQSIKQAQLDTLTWIPLNGSVLVIGGGTGWYLRALLEQHKIKKVVYIEASEKMLALTRKKIASLLPELTDMEIELRLGTEDTLHPTEQFDIVITHFFLDVFEPLQLNKIACQLKDVLRPEGLWLIADFRLPEQKIGIAYWWKKLLVKSMLFFFRVTSRITARQLPEFPELFAAMHMQLVNEHSYYNDLIVSSVYKKMQQNT